jgi:hypothetical protein
MGDVDGRSGNNHWGYRLIASEEIFFVIVRDNNKMCLEVLRIVDQERRVYNGRK